MKKLNPHINNILKKIDENDYDGMIVHNFNNIYYLSNYMPTSFAFLIISENPIIYTAKMDMEIASNNSSIQIEEFKSFSELNKILKKSCMKKIAIEADLPINTYKKFEEFELNTEEYIKQERAIKSENEINKINKALNIAHKSLL